MNAKQRRAGWFHTRDGVRGFSRKLPDRNHSEFTRGPYKATKYVSVNGNELWTLFEEDDGKWYRMQSYNSFYRLACEVESGACEWPF